MSLLNPLPGLLLALIPMRAYAIPTVNWCPSPDLPCRWDLDVSILNSAIYLAGVFGIFLTAMFTYYAVRVLASTADENAQAELRKAFAYAFFGVVLVAGAEILANSFTDFSGGTIADAPALRTSIIDPLLTFFKTFVGAALIVTITYNGIRLIISEDESQSSAARKRFIESLIGAVVVVLAKTIVDAFTPGTISAGALTTEIKGIAQYAATIFGLLAVIAIIVGGIFLVLSVQDSMKDRGRQIIIGGIVSLIIVYSSYAIVSLLIT